MAETEPLSEADWKEIAERTRRGECVLVLGPAIAVDPDDNLHTPLTTRLARCLADRLKNALGQSCGIVNADDLAHVSQVFCDEREFGRGSLEIAVNDFYARYDQTTTPLHRALAALPFQLVINTTPDYFMANAFKEAGKNPQAEHYDYQSELQRDVKLGRDDCPVIFDLYGSRHELSSLILTESDLLAFLVGIIKKAPPLPQSIGKLLADVRTTFLFVGFGFERWHVRILLHTLQAQLPTYKSFALESPDFFDDGERLQTMVYFQKKKFRFSPFSWERFATELKQHHEALVSKRKAQEPALPTTAPLAFLSYFREDAAAVSDVEEQLHVSGIRTWRDRHNLRGGDIWDEKISAVLGEVDYVVVIQSRRGEARFQSYVYNEIREALSRQKTMRSGVSFVIPTKIDDCKNLPEFERGRIQTIDLSLPGGVAALVTAIEEDWTRRQEVLSRQAVT